MAKYTGRGLVVKRPGVLSKVQMLNLVLGVRVFSLLPTKGPKIEKIQELPPVLKLSSKNERATHQGCFYGEFSEGQDVGG